MRQIILDTETTGLDPTQGHRIIEIGCVELINRRLTQRRLQFYLQPDRPIDPGAIEVHGITNEFLAGKPRFADIVTEFLEFIRGAELIIHNAAFDVAFINNELRLLAESSTRGTALADTLSAPPATRSTSSGPVAGIDCKVLCTLILARQLHPGQKNSLDALCKRYAVDNSQRQLHGALLDAEILADVYLAMTGGQASLSLDTSHDSHGQYQGSIRRLAPQRRHLLVTEPSLVERAAHTAQLETIDKASGGHCVWKRLWPENG